MWILEHKQSEDGWRLYVSQFLEYYWHNHMPGWTLIWKSGIQPWESYYFLWLIIFVFRIPLLCIPSSKQLHYPSIEEPVAVWHFFHADVAQWWYPRHVVVSLQAGSTYLPLLLSSRLYVPVNGTLSPSRLHELIVKSPPPPPQLVDLKYLLFP